MLLGLPQDFKCHVQARGKTPGHHEANRLALLP